MINNLTWNLYHIFDLIPSSHLYKTDTLATHMLVAYWFDHFRQCCEFSFELPASSGKSRVITHLSFETTSWLLSVNEARFMLISSWAYKQASEIRASSLNFRLSLHLNRNFVCASNEGSDETAHLPWLVWAIAAHICGTCKYMYMYQNHIMEMSEFAQTR